jgi:hypothetical protein
MLRREDWLRKAQGLCIGRQERIFHGRERRPNLIIWNKPDMWSCYCQACRKGDVVMKEHVRLDVLSPEAKRSDLSLPTDIRCHSMLDMGTQCMTATFLASKGMDNLMMPSWHYSCTRKRILIQTPEGWMGRDVTGNALEKWLTYNGQTYLWHSRGAARRTVVCEDTFSFLKLIWATQNRIECNVMCALGTGIKDSIMMRLLKQEYVQFMFDGDAAGYKGAAEGVARCRGLNISAMSCCSPAGKDPKDLSGEELRNLILGDTDAQTRSVCAGYSGGT